MYEEAAGLLHPFTPDFPPESPPPENPQLLQEVLDDDDGFFFSGFHTDIAGDAPHMHGGGGDIFSSLESITEAPVFADEDVILYDDIMSAETIEAAAGVRSIPELLVDELPKAQTEGPAVHKSISSSCRGSEGWAANNGGFFAPPQRSNFLDLPELEQLGGAAAAFGIRRAYSEGDIQAVGRHGSAEGNAKAVRPSAFDGSQPALSSSSSLISEGREEKLSRYRRKKSRRNFGHKIKYACRKASADNQLRVRGRFARADDQEASKMQ